MSKEDKFDEMDYESGCLVSFRNLTQEQKDIFLRLVTDECSYAFQVLYNIIQDDEIVMEIIDIFADKSIRFPSRKKMFTLLEKIQIYTQIKGKNFSDEQMTILARQMSKRKSQIKTTVDRIDYLLAGGNTLKDNTIDE